MQPFPHLLWLDYPIAVAAPRIVVTHTIRHVSHRLLLVINGHATIESSSPAGTVSTHWGPRSVGLFPCDCRPYTHTITSADGFQARVFCVPTGQIPRLSQRSAVDAPAPEPGPRTFDDGPLTAFLDRIPSCCDGHTAEEDSADVAVRRALARLDDLLGASPAPRSIDGGAFPASVMNDIVALIDSHLRDGVSPAAIANQVGLSPSHTAKKFRASTGISLERFLNRRRVRRSLPLLRTEALPVAELSHALGFSSQSHFTRVFSATLGIAPKQFQRLQRDARG